ncbi:acyl-coenzyme A thioesterase 9 [Marchantia polymorpha subsp. ruderalis]|uniref:HotDog ACOT-type domain-containing protein n=2 Tax=Marchantia polymorpha TaxID=3197 RepID=A0AAF6B7F6_MARPO|nr:hypothetical protein MARPO_0115s0031 [Marchantia polymorpha]BBN07940.1 hypothetical protein Mp_4g07500 [Marchantia polymorpha subsp. ruderalis]|eukprot:PTQ31112.1 hypothetical protein MARPO_0115s0031 [Marchantia polymorpha]
MSLPSALARGSSCSFARVLASRASSLGCYRSVSSFFEPGAPASARHSGPESGSDSGGKKEDEEQGKPRRSRFPSKVLRPESPVHWNLSDTMKKSDSIPVFSTVSNPDDASSATTKPLSMWPGMYHSPVTAALWNARSTILERAWLAPSDGPPQTTIMTKTPEESRTSILYALSTDKILREQYRNPWQGVRIGKLLEDLDALAGTIAVKHCADVDHTTRPLLLVTASVDKISLLKPLLLDEDLRIGGAVAWVGRSSMEIRMEVIQPVTEEEATEDDIALIANFTFVARDSVTKKAAQVNRLQPESVAEKKLFQEGEGRDERRKARMKDLSEGMRVGKVPYDAQKMQALLREGRVLIEMPTLADRNSILIRDTRLENAIVCQPQQRNMHGRIFGGFLMRRAYELSYTTCYVFCGTKPVFLEVDHVDFRRPVDVGDLLRFKACVLYTETDQNGDPLIHIEVVAHVIQPEVQSSEVSNTFYFTFTIDREQRKDGAPPILKVVPSAEEEARVVLSRFDADHPVCQLNCATQETREIGSHPKAELCEGTVPLQGFDA